MSEQPRGTTPPPSDVPPDLPPDRGASGAPVGETAAPPPESTSGSAGAKRTSRTRGRADGDPLRGSRTSGIWVAVIALVVVLILLAVFILQNTQETDVSYFGWTGTAPLSATLLIAAAGGALLVASAGALRILQLRRRVKRARKAR